MPKARIVVVCIERFDAPDGKVWAVRDGRQWLTAKRVVIDTAMATVFNGVKARQPKAYLKGYGVVRQSGDTVTISAH